MRPLGALARDLQPATPPTNVLLGRMSASPQQPEVSVAPPVGRGFLRRTFQAFHYRNFRLMWSGAFTSTTGSFVQEVAQSWLVYQLTDDPFLLGLTVFLNNAPILLFSLLGGVAADRMDRQMPARYR